MPLTPSEFSEIVQIFEEEIDGLILTMGKDVLLVFNESITPEIDPTFDPVYGGSRKPTYKYNNEIASIVEVQNTKIVRCLIEHNPVEFKTFSGKVYEPSDILLLKTYSSYVPDMRRCDYIIPDTNVQSIFGHRYRLIRDFAPRGLVNNRYASGYFQRVSE